MSLPAWATQTVVIYRSVRSLAREYPGGPWRMEWAEYSREPRPAVCWGGGGWAHARTAAEPIRVRVPRGELPAADPEAIVWLAERGEQGFSIEGSDHGQGSGEAA